MSWSNRRSNVRTYSMLLALAGAFHMALPCGAAFGNETAAAKTGSASTTEKAMRSPVKQGAEAQGGELVVHRVALDIPLRSLAKSSKAPEPETTIQVPPGDLAGKVMGLDGVTPLPNARVRFINRQSGEQVADTVTDADGEYQFAGLNTGTYVILVSMVGMGALVEVVPGAHPAILNLQVPEGFAMAHGGGRALKLGAAGTAAAGGGAIAGWSSMDRSDTGRRQVVSPIEP